MYSDRFQYGESEKLICAEKFRSCAEIRGTSPFFSNVLRTKGEVAPPFLFTQDKRGGSSPFFYCPQDKRGGTSPFFSNVLRTKGEGAPSPFFFYCHPDKRVYIFCKADNVLVLIY